MAKRRKIREGVYEYVTSTGEKRYLARWRDLGGRACEQGGFSTAKAAGAHRHAVLAGQARGIRRDPAGDRVTFAAWTERWWKAKRSTIATNTQLQYRTLLDRHVLPILGPRRLSSLRPIDVEELVAELDRGGLGTSGVSTSRKLVGQILEAAVVNDLVPTNVARGVKVKRTGATPKHALTPAEVEQLAGAVPDVYRALVLVLAYGGLRPGEAAALQRQDLDDLGQLHVRATVAEPRGHLERRETTKTYQQRTVPLPDRILDELRQHMAERVLWSPEAPIFAGEKGGPFRLSNFRRALRQAAARAGLPAWVTPYTLRHTCASLMARNGVGVHVAAQLMGHDPSEYLRTYVHLYAGDLRAAATALGRAREQGLAEVVELDPGAAQARTQAR
jgi:integrase